MNEKNLAAVLLGQRSRRSRHKGKTKDQISQMYRELRARRVDKKAIPNPAVS